MVSPTRRIIEAKLGPALDDEDAIFRVAMTAHELLENAAKYAPAGTVIEVSASAGNKEAVVEVADRGQGIPVGEEVRIFDKFYRAKPAREGGVGLGLTICRGIIEAHGGRIWAENRTGGGAVFRFAIPLSEEQPPIAAEHTGNHHASS